MATFVMADLCGCNKMLGVEPFLHSYFIISRIELFLLLNCIENIYFNPFSFASLCARLYVMIKDKISPNIKIRKSMNIKMYCMILSLIYTNANKAIIIKTPPIMIKCIPPLAFTSYHISSLLKTNFDTRKP